MDPGSALPGGVVPAGYPAQDVEVLLLDEDGRPTGEDAGEIALRSRYGAVGYWQMPELTAALFGPAKADGRRVYRTGDVGRIDPHGCLHHLGRRDLQVKISGNRVHLSEVEAALLDHDAVRAAAVVGREEAPGQTRLVAYVVPAGPTPPTVTELRRTVGARLPAFMVPSAFVVLDALPKTATGKVDRRALPAPDRARPALETPYAAPGTPLEERLAALWAELLHVDQVGSTTASSSSAATRCWPPRSRPASSSRSRSRCRSGRSSRAARCARWPARSSPSSQRAPTRSGWPRPSTRSACRPRRRRPRRTRTSPRRSNLGGAAAISRAGGLDMSAEQLWAVTAYFNPCGYRSRLANFRAFRARLDVPLVAVELVYGDRAELEAGDADVLVRVPGQDVLWQKERLLNVGLGALPESCDAVAWLDCDIVFASAGWARSVLDALDAAPVVQPFAVMYDLPRGLGPDAAARCPEDRARISLAAGMASGGCRSTSSTRRARACACATRRATPGPRAGAC